MKRALFVVLPFVFALVFSVAVKAEEKAGAGKDEMTVKVTVKDGKVMAKAGDKEYELKGDKAKDLKEGDYKIKGKIAEDGKSIEVTECEKCEAAK
jgi:hypothetical protein